jgi:glycosyltransferase involved in cell wall biosynthesis
MQIARIRHLFYPDMPHDYFYELSTRQAQQGHKVTVISWRKNFQYPQNICGKGFMINRLSGANLGLGVIADYPVLFGLTSKIEHLRPDIIHGESHLFLPSVQALKKANRLNLPYVVTIHGVFADRGLIINTAQKTYLYAIGEVFKKANKIICLTSNDATEIIKYGFSSEKIRLIPNAVDTQRFKPLDNPDEKLIVWTGRYVPEKGVEYLLEAAKFVQKDFPGVKFLLIGYGPEKIKLMRLASEYEVLFKSVFFSQRMSRNEIAKILGKASLFVCPSLKEGMPLSVLEAMACGLPVVGFAVSGVSDLVVNGKTGFLVTARNSRALADKILTLLKDKRLMKTFSFCAREIATEKYAWNTVLTNLETVYREAIEESSSVKNVG